MDMNNKVSLCCIFYETGTYFGMTAWCRGATNIEMILEIENWGGDKDFAIFDRTVASRFCQISNRVVHSFCQNLKGETQISPIETLFSALVIMLMGSPLKFYPTLQQ